MDWIENGPVSIPSGRIVAGAALAIFAAAVIGAGFGLHAAWREGAHRALGDIDLTGATQAVAAKPIVEIPQPEPPAAAANVAAANSAADQEDEADDTNEIAVKAAAAQAVQAQPAKSPADIDQILTSSTEKPQAPVKPSPDEDNPAKSDVPF